LLAARNHLCLSVPLHVARWHRLTPARSPGERPAADSARYGACLHPNMRSIRPLFCALLLLPLLACGSDEPSSGSSSGTASPGANQGGDGNSGGGGSGANQGGGGNSSGGGSGGGGSGCIGGGTQFPPTIPSPGCPDTPETGCTISGQVCTWTTGSSSVTYTCE